MVDAIASLATMEFEMDDWGVDVAVTCSQKGLMMPPGLSFVAAGEKALAVHGEAGFRTRYWDWTAREGELHYLKYCGTPPVHMLFGLRRSLDMLIDEGLENAFTRHRLLAEAVHAAVAVWAEAGVLEFNITEAAERAPSVTTILTNGNDPAALLDYCREKCGVVLGIGIGDLSGKAFRIAHMGHVNAPMVLGTLAVTETALVALGIPHGKGGVQAAIESLARSVKA
jgi:alanine-glyoxylate transaminase/serine-glyoxylate transaminase/serine-pyruvate transaminase